MFRLKARKNYTGITLKASEIRQRAVQTQTLGRAQLQCRAETRSGLKRRVK